jgi:hypothetical protein
MNHPPFPPFQGTGFQGPSGGVEWPKVEQKALIVRHEGYNDPLIDLNRFLSEGWQVAHTCPMPSSVAVASSSMIEKIHPTCLVVIARLIYPDSTPPS